MKKITKTLFSKQIDKYLIAGVIMLELIFTIVVALTWGRSSIDETEHLHISWLVSTGMVPYRDFFEHHNPLLWYIFAPISALFFNNAYVYYVGHFFSLSVSIFTLFYLYKILTRYITSPITALVALIVYGAFNWCSRITYIEFRPDVLMNFCFICGLYYYMRYMEKHRVKNLIIAFIMFTLSFLFLQKILLLLFFLGLYTLYRLLIKDFTWKDIAVALIAPAMIMSAFLAFLYYHGILGTYYDLNYTLNSILAQHFGLHQAVVRFENIRWYIPLINGYGAVDFDLYAVTAVILAVISLILTTPAKNKYLLLFCWLFGAELLLRYFTFSPNHHYFTLLKMQATVLAVTGIMLIRPKGQKILTGCILIYYIIAGFGDSYAYLTTQNSLKNHLRRIEFVLKNSDIDDTVLNGNKRNFNIYRKDADYLGFLLNDVGYVYNNNFGNKDYDINKLILDKKPKIIWMENYTNTSLYEKRFQAIRNFNVDLLYLWNKYPNQKYNINDLIITSPEFYAYTLDESLLSRYYEPTGLEKLWILKKHMDNQPNDDYADSNDNHNEN